MKRLVLAVPTGLMVSAREHFADTVDGVPSMRGLAVTDPTCKALRAGHRVPLVSTGRPDERPALEAPKRLVRAESSVGIKFVPAWRVAS